MAENESNDSVNVSKKIPIKAAGGWGALAGSLRNMSKQRAFKRGIPSLMRLNQKDGFDCPGCAWPEPEHRSAFEFCENGVKAVTHEATSLRVTPEFFMQHSVSELNKQSDHWLEAQGRLTHPMRYDAATDHYREVSWDDAFALIGEKLRGLESPNQAVFYTSGRTSNEAAFLYQLFVRQYGTNNLPDCSNMCHESSGVALNETIGIGKGTVSLADFDDADLIFVIGQNPGTNHPRMLTMLQTAAQRGTSIISLNPLRERALEHFIHPQHPLPMLTGRSTAITTNYYQPLIGGDLAVLKGICKAVLEAEQGAPGTVLDQAFIREHTHGFEAFRDDLLDTEWEPIVREGGLPRAEIEAIAQAYIASKATIACWAMGLTQHKHAVPTIQMVINLLLMRGNMGRKGAGACPVRGHSNVQGDRTMGIYELPPKWFLDSLGAAFNFEPPRDHGLDVVGAIQAMDARRAKVFIAMGGNFASATPDTELTCEALRRCDLTVQVSTKLNRSHTVPGKDALILPCLGRSEVDQQAGGAQAVTVEDSMSMVHASSGTLQPPSPMVRSEPAIVAGMAKATLGPREGLDWDGWIADYDRIRDKIEAVIPGFEQFNRRVKTPEGFRLPNGPSQRQWNTASGRAQFTVAQIPNLGLTAGQLRLMTIRSHDQFNTTVYDMNDRYRGVFNERMIIFMNAEDLTERGLKAGDMLDLVSHHEDGERRAKGFKAIAYDIPRGCAAAYFPETNGLISVNSYADRSRTPTSKFVPITVSKATT